MLALLADLQMRRDATDNSKIVFLISEQKRVVTPH